MAVTVTGSAESPKADTPQQEETIGLELARIHRYHFGNVLYVKDTVYYFDADTAKDMLRLRAPNKVPVFTLARKRKRMIEVEVDPREEARVARAPTKQELALAESFNLVVDGKPVKPPVPVNAVDLSDDDPEILAKLSRADEDELDTGVTQL